MINHDSSSASTRPNNERVLVASIVDVIQHLLLPFKELEAHYLLDELRRGHCMREG